MKTTVALPDETLRAFGGDELQARVFCEKYALRDDSDQVKETTPAQMWTRVAREIASAEPDPARVAEWEAEFYWLLSDFRFLPGGRILHGAGSPRKVTLINCFFERIQEDSIEGIYTAAMHAARTYSRGGGIGVDISPLRSANSPVNNAARVSTGAVSFMELFSLTTGLIGQSGRRGALLISIEDRHPDVLDFCRVKRNLTAVRFANISVKLSDAFMRAVEENGPWTLWFESPEVGRIERVIRARELWNELVTGARDWAEPGCLFWDTVKRHGTSEYNGMEVEGCNPCAEQVLGHGDCCDLGSINLARFVLDTFTPRARVDEDGLIRAIRAAVRFLDNVHEYSLARHLYPLPHQENAARRGRRIGVGITGLGDMLVQLGLRYDSDEAIAFAGNLVRSIKEAAYRASVDLAKEKGSFPAFDPDKHLAQRFFERFPEGLVEDIRRYGLRNVSLLTIPPVGSGSAMAGCTNGLEPIFALSYVRRSESLSQEYFNVLHPLVSEYLRTTGRPIDLDELSRTRDPDGYLRERLPPAFVTAHQIDPLRRVTMQAALQRHIDQAISSCLTGDHLILTDRGLRYIDQIVPHAREPKTFSPLDSIWVVTNDGLAPAQSFYCNGVAPTYKVGLEGHFEIRGTGHHKVLTLDPATYTMVWKQLDGLHAGDWVVMRKGLELWGNLNEWKDIYGTSFHYNSPRADTPHVNRIRIPSRMSTDLARFLGYLNANGTVLHNSVTFSNQDDDALEDFCRISESLFGTKPSLACDPRAKRLYSARIHSRKLVAFLRFLGLGDKRADKHTPLCVLSAGRETVKEYIRGLTLDGYVADHALGVLGNRSSWLIREVQQMILNFGIDSNITVKTYDRCDLRKSTGRLYTHELRSYYTLYVTGEAARKYMELIGYAQARKQEAALQRFLPTRPSRKILSGAIPSSPLLLSLVGTRMRTVKTNSLYNECLSLQGALRDWEAVGRERLAHTWEGLGLDGIPSYVVDPTYLFKRVQSVGECGAAATFDLSVPGPEHYVANGIVSHNTVNLPREATAQTVEQVYFHAWRSGLKGISVYVEGSREGVLLTPEEARRRHAMVAVAEKVTAIAREAVPALPADGGATPEQQIEAVVHALAALAKQRPEQLELIATPDGLLRDRPERLDGPTYRIPTAFGTMFITMTEQDGEPFEIFARLGKAGSDAEADAEGLGRLCSTFLRLRGRGSGRERLQLIVDQLEGIGGSRHYGFGLNRVRSIPDAIAVALRKYLAGGQPADGAETLPAQAAPEATPITGGSNGDICPRCHERSLATTEGCTKCANPACGFREC